MTPSAALLVLQSVSPSTAAISSFWPNTVVGWITVLGFVASVLAAVFTGGKLWGKIVGIETTIADKFQAQDEKFSSLLGQHEKDVQSSLNGLGARVGDIEDAERHREGMFDAIRTFMTESREDRKHMRAALDVLAADVREQRKETAEREREGRKEAEAREARLMDAIRDMRRGA